LASHVQAQLMEGLYAVTWQEPPADGRVAPEEASRYPWCEVEVAFALRWTRTAAGARLEQARQLVEDLPQVQQALDRGDIDMPKALLIAPAAGPDLHWLAMLSPDDRVGQGQRRRQRTTAGRGLHGYREGVYPGAVREVP
jgi:hypothetical protein